MAKLTLPKLEWHLFVAADILRGKMDTGDYMDFIFVMPLLKRGSDLSEEEQERFRAREAEGGTRDIESARAGAGQRE